MVQRQKAGIGPACGPWTEQDARDCLGVRAATQRSLVHQKETWDTRSQSAVSWPANLAYVKPASQH